MIPAMLFLALLILLGLALRHLHLSACSRHTALLTVIRQTFRDHQILLGQHIDNACEDQANTVSGIVTLKAERVIYVLNEALLRVVDELTHNRVTQEDLGELVAALNQLEAHQKISDQLDKVLEGQINNRLEAESNLMLRQRIQEQNESLSDLGFKLDARSALLKDLQAQLRSQESLQSQFQDLALELEKSRAAANLAAESLYWFKAFVKGALLALYMPPPHVESLLEHVDHQVTNQLTPLAALDDACTN